MTLSELGRLERWAEAIAEEKRKALAEGRDEDAAIFAGELHVLGVIIKEFSQGAKLPTKTGVLIRGPWEGAAV